MPTSYFNSPVAAHDLRPVEKSMTCRTHRICDPQETLDWLMPKLSPMGITRLSDITGLDRIGIPIAQAVRPLGRSLSVSQGKGLTLTASLVSAGMEAAETWHAEFPVVDTVTTTAASLAEGEAVAPLGDLAVSAPKRTNMDQVRMQWTEAWDLLTETPIWVPMDCVHMDFTRDAETRFLSRSSNGLASGNTPDEAIAHGLLEVIERDCIADFKAMAETARRKRRINPEHVANADPALATLLERIHRADVNLEIWDITNDLSVPTFMAQVFELGSPSNGMLGAPVPKPSAGYGCHLDPITALIRAITEAVQSRLTSIAGSRDDLPPRRYDPAPEGNISNMMNRIMDQVQFGYQALNTRDQSTHKTDGDVACLLDRIAWAGVGHVAVVNLSREEIGIPVFRIIAPGMSLNFPRGFHLGTRHLGRRGITV